MWHHLGAVVSDHANIKTWWEKRTWVAITVQFPASPIHYFRLLFNTVEFVELKGVKSAYPWCYLIRRFKDGISFTSLEVSAFELEIWALSVTE